MNILPTASLTALLALFGINIVCDTSPGCFLKFIITEVSSDFGLNIAKFWAISDRKDPVLILLLKVTYTPLADELTFDTS